MALRIGDTFAGYRVLGLLGSGGMGEVYLVQHPRLPRQEALKVLRPDISSDTSFRERFTREADLAAGLRHPNIVGIHDRGEHDGQLWITMDYIDGTDLSHLLEQRYPQGMPIGHVLTISSAVASALDYAHKKGLLHRDVKPANIIVADLDTDDPNVFLADFGIARPLGDTGGITTTNMTVGTVAYAAPEQLMGEDIDGRVDQYALAATTYHLLTGSQLFPNSNPAVVISRHLNSQPPRLAANRADLADLDDPLVTALDKEPANRYRDCTSFARTLTNRATLMRPAAPTEAAIPAGDAESVTAENRGRTVTDDFSANIGWLALAAAALIVVVAIVALVGSEFWSTPDVSSARTNPPVPGGTATTSSPLVPILPPPSPPPSSFSAKAIDSLLLSADELNGLLGTYGTSGTRGEVGLLKVDQSAYGMSDNATLVTPPSCVGVVFTAEQSVYGNTEFEEARDQKFRPEPYVSTTSRAAPYLVQQTVTVYPTAQDAEAVVSSSEQQWGECSAGEVREFIPPEDSRSFTLGSVQRKDSLVAVSMASNSGYSGAHACQQVLGARENVVVSTRVCTTPASVTHPSVPANPGWATDDAERLATAMLDKVQI